MIRPFNSRRVGAPWLSRHRIWRRAHCFSGRYGRRDTYVQRHIAGRHGRDNVLKLDDDPSECTRTEDRTDAHTGRLRRFDRLAVDNARGDTVEPELQHNARSPAELRDRYRLFSCGSNSQS
jgi:hypothetical protein